MAPCFCFMAVNHSSHTYNTHLNMSIENEFLWHILLQIHWNKYLSYDIFNKLLFDCFYLLYENEMARQLAKPPQLLDNRAGEPLWSCAVPCWIVAGLGSIWQSYTYIIYIYTHYIRYVAGKWWQPTWVWKLTNHGNASREIERLTSEHGGQQ